SSRGARRPSAQLSSARSAAPHRSTTRLYRARRQATRGGFVVHSLMSMRRLPRLALVTAVVAVAGVAVAVALANNRSTDLTFTPQKADQVTNIDVLRQQIANYYGDPGKTGVFGADSNYANEAESVAKDGANW